MRSATKITMGFVLVGAMAFFGSCSGSQEDDEELANSENENAAAADGENINNASDDTALAGNNAAMPENAAPVNGAGADGLPDDGMIATEATDPAATNPAAMPANNPLPETAPPPADSTVNTAAAIAAPTPAPEAAPPPAGLLPNGASRVRYVKHSTQKVAQPGGAVVGSFEKGDHPLVINQNGGYDQLSNGTYVQGDALSDKGIGRDKKKVPWNAH